jgi:predicted ATPase
MRKFILTGAPGAGKTTLIRHLANRGYGVAEEAATEIIAREQEKGIQEPWNAPSFIEMILKLQRQRQVQAASSPSEVQFFDRSPLDAYILCRYSDLPISPALLADITQAQEAGNYERDVFFIENLGFCEPSEARKISFEESLRFERITADIYAEWGYRCIAVPRQSVEERLRMILTHIVSLAGVTAK